MPIAHWQQQFEQYLIKNWAQDDKAHDVAHFRRVWKTAQHIIEGTEADRLVVLTACYFHDIVNLPKNHPERHLASTQAAQETLRILDAHFPEFPRELYDDVAHAVRAHSFSAAIEPQTLEAKAVQDADRLESLGAIGLARVFYVSGALGRSLFDSEDPLAESRELDDTLYSLDHVQRKLLRLPGSMQTEAGRALAHHNADFLVGYMAKLCAELKGDYLALDDQVIRRFKSQR
ncbi:phosphohydrolase [Cedecea davisae]|uniref:Phosphohydrolase n=1 Tax=Cedecea davisae TaxID=158484 RepID=A0ABS6DCN4_9ENTR|nr:phosphohydrolase [Cedecea davisae]MBU4680968.1 phosphohydrolase [Cedecea davisae]MBU4687662.1 phosphohydrolase [Cedecea davisae]